MRCLKRAACVFVLFFAICLCGCDVSEMSTLPEFSRPYAAVYECDELTIDGEDELDRFDVLRLELNAKGEFALSWKTKEGAKGEQRGEYDFRQEENRIVFTAERGGRKVRRGFPYEDGKIYIDLNLLGRSLHARFSLGK